MPKIEMLEKDLELLDTTNTKDEELEEYGPKLLKIMNSQKKFIKTKQDQKKKEEDE